MKHLTATLFFVPFLSTTLAAQTPELFGRESAPLLAAGLGGCDVDVFDTIAKLRKQDVGTTRQASVALGYSTPNDGGGGLFYWDAASELEENAGTVFTSTKSADGRWIREFSGPVHASWWGLAGDGSNETTGLQAAFDAAGSRGIVFSEPATYGFAEGLTVPDDVRIWNNGATLLLVSATGTTALGLSLGDRVTANHLKLRVASGVNTRRLVQLGARNVIDELEISSDQAQQNDAGIFDGALQIRSEGTRIGRATIDDFFQAAVIYQAEHATIEELRVTNHTRGVLVRESSGVRLLSGSISDSATTSPSSNHNGVRIDSSHDVVVTDLSIYDANDDAVRVAGQSSSQLTFGNLQCVRPKGAGAFISPAPGQRVRQLQINGLTVVDAGAGGFPFADEDGLYLERCTNVAVTGFHLQRETENLSAYNGIQIEGCNFVSLDSPRISDVLSVGIRMEDGSGPINDVFVDAPSILNSGGTAIYVDSSTEILRGVNVIGAYIRGQGGWGIAVQANAGSVGVNQPMVLDGWVQDTGFGTVFVSTTDSDVHVNVHSM